MLYKLKAKMKFYKLQQPLLSKKNCIYIIFTELLKAVVNEIELRVSAETLMNKGFCANGCTFFRC